MRHWRPLLLIYSLLCILTIACTRGAKSDFVLVKEGKFYIGERPYRYVGTNFWYGALLGSQGEGGDRARLARELDHMKACGINNLRILVGADGANGDRFKVEPTLQTKPGEYNAEVLDGLDYLLSEMGKRGMYAILYLNNSWEWSGGYSQYLTWSGHGEAPLPAVDGWETFRDYVSQFADSKEAQALFMDHVRYILGRTNAYTRKKYIEDPTIMSWQIGNEPRAFSDAAKPGFEAWMKEAAALIRELDPNHLISTGSEGKYGCEVDMSLFERLHADPNVDYLTIHIWPYNWNWVDKGNIPSGMDSALMLTHLYIDEHVEVAQRLNKPLVIEEFGFPRDSVRYTPGSPTTLKDRYYTDLFGYVLESIQKGAPLAGANFWAWGGEGCTSEDHDYWQRGDDYTGDPAQEPQGLYSVFAVDSSTMEIITRYARSFSELK